MTAGETMTLRFEIDLRQEDDVLVHDWSVVAWAKDGAVSVKKASGNMDSDEWPALKDKDSESGEEEKQEEEEKEEDKEEEDKKEEEKDEIAQIKEEMDTWIAESEADKKSFGQTYGKFKRFHNGRW